MRQAAISVQTQRKTYDLRDVSTSIASLVAGGGGSGLTIYNDLGTGASYGTRTFSASDNATTVNMIVNATGLSAINSSAGNQFALGGFLSTIPTTIDSSTQALFTFSDSTTTAGSSLVLTVGPAVEGAPEPGSLALLGTGLVPLAGVVLRRRRAAKTTA